MQKVGNQQHLLQRALVPPLKPDSKDEEPAEAKAVKGGRGARWPVRIVLGGPQ